jgi:hypothetical protein
MCDEGSGWRALPIVFLVALAATGCLHTDSKKPVLPREIGTAWRGTGVVHARWVSNERLEQEEWLDRRTGATRKVVYDRRGKLIWVGRGARILSWSEPQTGASLLEGVDARDPILLHGSDLLAPWRMMRTGRAHIVEAGEVDGRPTWSVRIELPPSPERPEDFEFLVDVDRDTFLPVRERRRGRGLSGTRAVRLEYVPRSALASNLFSFQRRWRHRERRLRYSELPGPVRFSVYALGHAYAGLRFGIATVIEDRGEGTQGLPPEFRGPQLAIGYVRGDPFDEHVVQLIERPAGARRRFRPPRVTFVTVGGARRAVSLTPDGRFSLVVDGTWISGYARLPSARVLALLGELREVR